MPDPATTLALERLVQDGLLLRADSGLRTTARFQAGLARAAYALQRAHAPWRDLRLPIAGALAEHYRAMSDEELAVLVEAMLAIEERELGPILGAAVGPGR